MTTTGCSDTHSTAHFQSASVQQTSRFEWPRLPGIVAELEQGVAQQYSDRAEDTPEPRLGGVGRLDLRYWKDRVVLRATPTVPSSPPPELKWSAARTYIIVANI